MRRFVILLSGGHGHGGQRGPIFIKDVTVELNWHQANGDVVRQRAFIGERLIKAGVRAQSSICFLEGDEVTSQRSAWTNTSYNYIGGEGYASGAHFKPTYNAIIPDPWFTKLGHPIMGERLLLQMLDRVNFRHPFSRIIWYHEVQPWMDGMDIFDPFAVDLANLIGGLDKDYEGVTINGRPVRLADQLQGGKFFKIGDKTELPDVELPSELEAMLEGITSLADLRKWEASRAKAAAEASRKSIASPLHIS
eukprot:TRINITY_DN67291_c0_g1_i1.p1 TRINITY_DN67291_c0_g1~~TRINITY_DN67291_c0_g1_i1.p1  ORF type:complete len:250 (-),score=58.88 TRINITY_DN67291_c0_g1_i1:154-903(-)